MPTMSRVPDISQAEVASLQSAGYADIEAAWRAVEAQEFEEVAKRVSVEPRRLAELLVVQELVKGQAARVPLRDHIWGVLIQTAWSVVVGLATVALAALIAGPITQFVVPPNSATYAIVAPADGIPAYKVLSAGDVLPRTGSLVDKDFLRPESVVGRYALQPLVAGDILRRSQISVRPITVDEMKGRRIVSLNVALSAVPEVAVPETVTLVLSPLPNVDPAAAPELMTALLLNTRRTTDRTIVDVAVLDSDLPRLGRLAGQSVVLLAAPGLTLR
jgi:hypothetical protein